MTGERAERRLAAIFAADVVGYSRLVSADEEGTLTRLGTLRRDIIEANIARHSGRLFKIMGDGFLAEFASAVQAVSCALAIQTETEAAASGFDDAQKIRLRIGIHVGDVLVAGEDLMGDGINIAARLESIAAPGGISISRAVHDQVRDRIKTTFDDKGEVSLKNIARPVQVFAVAEAKGVAPIKVTPSALALPNRPSIAVLPFQNMSGDPEQEYFADGVVEDIITALSTFKSLFVIAHNSTFTYKGKPIDIKQVGRELGVRYVLEGSIRKGANRVRITGQLIEASTGTHLWAEKIDGELRDVFELQDQITAKVVSSVAPTIERAEIERAKRTTSTVDSYDAYLRGMASFSQRQMPEARGHFKKATERDPEYAAAYAMSAFTYVSEMASKGIIPSSEMRAAALRDAETALRIGSEDPFVLARCAHPLAYVCQQLDRAALLADRAVALNSNLSVGWLSRGWISIMRGEAERAIESFENLLRLSPLDPLRPFSLSGVAFGYFFLDRYDEGRRIAGEIMQLLPHHQSFGAYIANCVGAGDLSEARSAASLFLKFDPSFRVSRAPAIFVIQSPKMREKFDGALRTAGIPE